MGELKRKKGRPYKIYDKKYWRLEVRLDDMHYNMVKELCDVSGYSVSELIRRLIYDAYEESSNDD